MKHLTLLLSTALLAAAVATAAAQEPADPDPSSLPPGPDFKTVLDLPSPGEATAPAYHAEARSDRQIEQLRSVGTGG